MQDMLKANPAYNNFQVRTSVCDARLKPVLAVAVQFFFDLTA
jgi:hypothetical protein